MRGRSEFLCESCGTRFHKWSGQCGNCGQWNTIIEVPPEKETDKRSRFRAGRNQVQSVQTLGSISGNSDAKNRIGTGLGELDRVLGGGLVRGSVVLLGGDPGIGKTTLLLQSLALVQKNSDFPVLYISGEESADQIALRARRLGVPSEDLRLLTETKVEDIIATTVSLRPTVFVVDSVQTLYSEALQSPPGTVAQVRECASRLVGLAKSEGLALYLIGHVTKEGSIAGPRILEHMVDTTLYFEGDTDARYRIVRAIKNRFGAVNEIGVFQMTDSGLREVSNPSAILLSRHEKPVAGSVVLAMREGSRPMLVEVQALVDENTYSTPRRVTVGLDPNRLSMLLAILNRQGGLSTAGCDVFVNVVGGVRVTETAADLAIVLAVLSSMKDRPLAEGLVVFGEIGLAGEIRPVPGGADRLRESFKHGYKKAIAPRGNVPRDLPDGVEISVVGNLAEAIEGLC